MAIWLLGTQNTFFQYTYSTPSSLLIILIYTNLSSSPLSWTQSTSAASSENQMDLTPILLALGYLQVNLICFDFLLFSKASSKTMSTLPCAVIPLFSLCWINGFQSCLLSGNRQLQLFSSDRSALFQAESSQIFWSAFSFSLWFAISLSSRLCEPPLSSPS